MVLFFLGHRVRMMTLKHYVQEMFTFQITLSLHLQMLPISPYLSRFQPFNNTLLSIPFLTPPSFEWSSSICFSLLEMQKNGEWKICPSFALKIVSNMRHASPRLLLIPYCIPLILQLIFSSQIAEANVDLAILRYLNVVFSIHSGRLRPISRSYHP